MEGVQGTLVLLLLLSMPCDTADWRDGVGGRVCNDGRAIPGIRRMGSGMGDGRWGKFMFIP